MGNDHELLSALKRGDQDGWDEAFRRLYPAAFAAVTAGLAIAFGELGDELNAVLGQIQNDLFDVGADLATPVVADPKSRPSARNAASLPKKCGG